MFCILYGGFTVSVKSPNLRANSLKGAARERSQRRIDPKLFGEKCYGGRIGGERGSREARSLLEAFKQDRYIELVRGSLSCDQRPFVRGKRPSLNIYGSFHRRRFDDWSRPPRDHRTAYGVPEGTSPLVPARE